ncbi:MAG: NADH-quinone oxidoreductase subunit J [Rickettsiaceae bacterium]|nr:NADH-quinone oxidoreductase subunit J [Rickettsiaceae bacterium]
MALFFYIFASMAVFGSICVIGSKNPVHAVLWLIFTFCNSAALLVLIGAEFIAMMLIIIYVGAVAVLFLFVVMMLNVEYSTIKAIFSRNLTFIIPMSLLLFLDLVLIIFLSNKSVKANLMHPITNDVTNIQAIGRVLYTDFILPFQTSGIILFLAMVASIVLTHRYRSGVKRQDITQQLARNKNNSLFIATNDGKQGLNNLSYDE